MGRPRKPTAVKIAEGRRAHRPLPQNEPEFTPGFGEAPAGLSEFGQRIWNTATEELDRLNLLSVADHGALTAAVRGADQANTADVAVGELLALVRSGKAEQQDYYRLSIMNSVSKKSWQQWKSFCTEFGLTPASRSRISVESAAPAGATRAAKVDPIEAALSESLSVQ